MDNNDRVILVVLFLVGLYFYSNQSINKDTIEKKYGAASDPSPDEGIYSGPIGFALGSKTFPGRSPLVSTAWYA
jgi:hypothetical protein